MIRSPATGDVPLTARPATAESFAPFGRLLGPGDRDRLGKRGSVLVALDEGKPGPRRFTHLQNYPRVRRLVLPLGDQSLLLVVLGPGDPPSGPPSAFRIPAGHAVVIERGVWHAGPFPLEEGSIVEILETRGPADRLDRQSLRELAGIDGVRVVLPEEPGAPGPGLDLAAAGSVVLERTLEEDVRLGMLLLDDLVVVEDLAPLESEAAQVADALRAMWRPRTDPDEVPGVTAVRALWDALGMNVSRIPPPGEALLEQVLRGLPVPRSDSLSGALALSALRLQVALYGYDAARLGDRVQLRVGGPDERFAGAGGERVRLAGVPVLCDPEGPFGSPAGETARVRIGTRTRRALIALFLPSSLHDPAAGTLLDEVSQCVRRHCGGVEYGRFLTGCEEPAH